MSSGSSAAVVTVRDAKGDALQDTQQQEGKISGSSNATDADLSVVPRILQCFICLKLLDDPVKTANGCSYDRQCIESWFKGKIPYTKPPLDRNSKGIKDLDDPEPLLPLLIEPKTGLPLSSIDLTPDEDMEGDVTEFKRRKQEFVDIKYRIIDSIPTDIMEQLKVLDSSSIRADTENIKELSQKREIIESSPAVLQYYVTMQLAINAVLTTCALISWDIESNQRGSFENHIMNAIETYDEINIAYLGLDIFRELFFDGKKNKADDKSKEGDIEQLTSVFLNDSTLISLVAERVARGMALFRKKELEKKTSDSSHMDPERGQASAQQVTDSLRTAVEACLNTKETCHSKLGRQVA